MLIICYQNQSLQKLFFQNHLAILFLQNLLHQSNLEQIIFCFAFFQRKIHYFKQEFLCKIIFYTLFFFIFKKFLLLYENIYKKEKIMEKLSKKKKEIIRKKLKIM